MLRQHQGWIEDLVIRLLCVFALDRFGDFVSDEVFYFIAFYLNRVYEHQLLQILYMHVFPV